MRQKKIWIICLSIGIGISLLMMSSCEKTTLVSYNYTVEHVFINHSGEDLTMRVYNYKNEMFKSFILENTDSIYTHVSQGSGPGIFFFSSFSDEIGDSVVVKFNDDKCIIYDRDSRNGPFDVKEYDNYSDELIQQSHYTLYYTFTEEDYNLAVDCE